MGQQVVQRLALHHHFGVAIVHEYYGRADEPIVIARHHVIVSARCLNRDDIARLQLWGLDVIDEHVRFAVLAGDGDRPVVRLCGLVGADDLVDRVVELRARIVRHSAVHGYISSMTRLLGDRHRFNRAHRVERRSRLPDDRATGLLG